MRSRQVPARRAGPAQDGTPDPASSGDFCRVVGRHALARCPALLLLQLSAGLIHAETHGSLRGSHPGAWPAPLPRSRDRPPWGRRSHVPRGRQAGPRPSRGRRECASPGGGSYRRARADCCRSTPDSAASGIPSSAPEWRGRVAAPPSPARRLRALPTSGLGGRPAPPPVIRRRFRGGWPRRERPRRDLERVEPAPPS